MTYSEVYEFMPVFAEGLQQRFKESYPSTFLHTTEDETELTNKSMYSYYIKIVNSLVHIPETPTYKQGEDYNDFSFFKRLYDDFMISANWQAFVIEFIPLKH